ncbi:hypothetical protein BASA60_001567 [Batrachochytrium salamandrivorans]|nr:hypothetical protein BASA62_007013 [Batrachochytrium salamandrivorans]KAH6583248.1 hypothetical protein BASA60_001567 [Batrachochytrium salamandrivorans]
MLGIVSAPPQSTDAPHCSLLMPSNHWTHLLHLPVDVILLVLQWLDPQSLCHCEQTCSRLRRVMAMNDRFLWLPDHCPANTRLPSDSVSWRSLCKEGFKWTHSLPTLTSSTQHSPSGSPSSTYTYAIAKRFASFADLVESGPNGRTADRHLGTRKYLSVLPASGWNSRGRYSATMHHSSVCIMGPTVGLRIIHLALAPSNDPSLPIEVSGNKSPCGDRQPSPVLMPREWWQANPGFKWMEPRTRTPTIAINEYRASSGGGVTSFWRFEKEGRSGLPRISLVSRIQALSHDHTGSLCGDLYVCCSGWWIETHRSRSHTEDMTAAATTDLAMGMTEEDNLLPDDSIVHDAPLASDVHASDGPSSHCPPHLVRLWRIGSVPHILWTKRMKQKVIDVVVSERFVACILETRGGFFVELLHTHDGSHHARLSQGHSNKADENFGRLGVQTIHMTPHFLLLQSLGSLLVFDLCVSPPLLVSVIDLMQFNMDIVPFHIVDDLVLITSYRNYSRKVLLDLKRRQIIDYEIVGDGLGPSGGLWILHEDSGVISLSFVEENDLM